MNERSEPDDPEDPIAPFEPRDGVPLVIEAEAALRDFADRLAAGSGPLAVDAERASGYRYGQRAYLVQVRREGSGTALIDPIAVPDLAPIQAATVGVEWILHAATQDLPCLAEVGLSPSALFDTELAGRLLGRERVSLAALVASELGQVLEKGHGATDWSLRPLSAAQLRYAALDVELLAELRDVLDQALVEAGKRAIAAEEFDALLSFAPRARGEDEWRRTSGIHRLRKPRALAIVRELWLARDDIARRRDIAVGRILPDAAIVAAAHAAPGDADALAALPEFRGRGASRYLREWWQAVARALALPAAGLPAASPPPSGPPQPRSWPDRDPVAAARLEAARSGLAAIAQTLGMPTENLLSPDTVRRLCWEPPADGDVASALARMGARPWQVAACCESLLAALAATPPVDATGQ
ncbi:MAG: HRDC domain-containing protein [Actinomycetota bacterium]|nr:HRDC domain-containing protein [Actinomycetota bacterium]